MSLLPFGAGGALTVLLAIAPGTLRDARVRIEVRGDTALVTARYRIADAGDSVRFNLIRLNGQTLKLDVRLADRRFRVDTLPGLLRLRAEANGRSFPLEIRYLVVGGLARIPLFVPETPTAPGQSRVTIAVQGSDRSRAAAFVFPRFSREGNRGWLATPDHLPSFVTVVDSAGAVPVPGLAQWAVVVLALAATGAWLVAQRRVRRPA